MSTPPSPTDTIHVSSPASPKLGPVTDYFSNPRIPASNIIEYIASRAHNSSAVYLYDLAEQLGFGSLTKLWSKDDPNAAPVISLQTRAGAALSLIGRLSEGTSKDGTMLTAYTSLNGLAMMTPALSYLPTATSASRLVLQVSNLSYIGDDYSLSPSLAPIASIIPILPSGMVVLASGTPQETADFTQLAYNMSSHHVIHIFDHFSSSREIGHNIEPLPAKQDAGESVSTIIKRAGYSYFNYVGDPKATTVLVMVNGPYARIANALVSENSGFGVLTVSVLRPWDESAFLDALPRDVRVVHVFDDVPNSVTHGFLYIDVFSTIVPFSNAISVHSHRIVPELSKSFTSTQTALSQFLSARIHLDELLHPSTPSKKLLVFGTPGNPLSSFPYVLQDVFLTHKGVSSRLVVDHDVVTKATGLFASRIILGSTKQTKPYLPVSFELPLDLSTDGQVDFLAIVDPSLLKTHTLFEYCRPKSAVLCATPWSPAELISNLPHDSLKLLATKGIRVFLIDAKAIADKFAAPTSSANSALQNFVVHLAFLRLYLGPAARESLVLQLALGAWSNDVQGIELLKINAHTWVALEELDLAALDMDNVQKNAPLRHFEFSAVTVEQEESGQNQARLGVWHDAAKHLLFAPAFRPAPSSLTTSESSHDPALRPEIPDQTFLITCTVNRRLTPIEYDRNVFHLEFDSSGTGLRYAIGEALGVHGWNDEQEVLEFCAWYGVNPNRLITIPVIAGEPQMHTRTVFQSLQQQIDLFGRPPKSFYSDLAAYATSSVDRHALLFIGSPEGSATFKKLSEKDTVTFADVLKMYPSAKPGIEILCELIGDIKPRHYSIASAQSVVGDRVDLLVVTVDWVTPSGSPRYGQCTRYLAGLRVGQKVTVSIKPSVMKLPPDNNQPLILAGLGTGAAPFRAFLQHRAWLVRQGLSVGPVYYYFGSRHQSQEYLYGEEIESFIFDGVITRAGLAFSRDGPKKVYIQHKMLEDAEDLVRMLHQENGVFYLCGPTWPVPDVFETLVEALVKYRGEDIESAGAYLEGLKEEERYVLEVY